MTGSSKKEVGRYFTEKARVALAEARRRAKETPVLRETVEVFVTRISGSSYGWEIRQFGGVELERAQETFSTPAEAQAAGGRALAGRFPAKPDGRLL
jgi:hypothetical protein